MLCPTKFKPAPPLDVPDPIRGWMFMIIIPRFFWEVPSSAWIRVGTTSHSRPACCLKKPDGRAQVPCIDPRSFQEEHRLAKVYDFSHYRISICKYPGKIAQGACMATLSHSPTWWESWQLNCSPQAFDIAVLRVQSYLVSKLLVRTNQILISLPTSLHAVLNK